ncbi:MAG TPA: RagB/SusD family nutrient uptake outer membrane protein [Puia sp.]
MKRKNYKLLIPGSLALIVLLIACGKNFLDKPPLGVLSPSILATKTGVQGLLIGAYSAMTGQGVNNGGWGSAADNWTYGSVAADDAYKGSTNDDQPDIVPLLQWATPTTNSYIGQKWAAMYDGIQRCNDVIRTMRVASPALDPADTLEFKAEASFLRAYFHFELRKVFFYPPYVDESISISNNNTNVPNNDASGYIEIWPKIEADFSYAMTNLPSTQPNKGQANKWAAEAYLAKVYMFEGKYSAAQTLLDELIASGNTASGAAYTLQPNYAQNFNPDPGAKNSGESVFAVQISVNDGAGPAGGKGYGDKLNYPYNGGPGACCGFDVPTQDIADACKTDATGLPLPLATFNQAPHVSDQTAGAYVGNLDPRIDIIMGRLNIPYLDWGPCPGDAWVRDPGDEGHFSPKKTVFAKSVSGTYNDAGTSGWAQFQQDAVNINLIRFADILLWDAECHAIAGDLAKAEDLVNQVRTRAANPLGWVYSNGAFDPASYTYKGGTTPADLYKVAPYPLGYFSTGAIAMQAIIMERRIELAEEGHRFFDLQRWQAGNSVFPATGYMTTTLNTYAAIESVFHPALYSFAGAGIPNKFTTGKCEYFPIPQQQVDAENSQGTINLKQIPGY